MAKRRMQGLTIKQLRIPKSIFANFGIRKSLKINRGFALLFSRIHGRVDGDLYLLLIRGGVQFKIYGMDIAVTET